MSAGGDEVYDDFAATFGRRHSSPEEYEHRRGVFHDNRQFIEDWNAQAPNTDSHMLGLNHFADWTEVVFMLPSFFQKWLLADLASCMQILLHQLALSSGQVGQ